MYHRPRDEDKDDDEPPPFHWERGSYSHTVNADLAVSLNVIYLFMFSLSGSMMRGEPRC